MLWRNQRKMDVNEFCMINPHETNEERRTTENMRQRNGCSQLDDAYVQYQLFFHGIRFLNIRPRLMKTFILWIVHHLTRPPFCACARASSAAINRSQLDYTSSLQQKGTWNSWTRSFLAKNKQTNEWPAIHPVLETSSLTLQSELMHERCMNSAALAGYSDDRSFVSVDSEYSFFCYYNCTERTY